MTTLGTEILYISVILCTLVAEEEQTLGALCAAGTLGGNSDALTQSQYQRSCSLVSACHSLGVTASSRTAALAGTDVNLVTPYTYRPLSNLVDLSHASLTNH